MDAIQNKVIGLLQEIHDVCEQLNTGYVLGGVTAEEAKCFGCMTPGRYTATVYMTLKDFLVFKAHIEDNRSSDRIIEGLDNNNRFPGFYFHYIDKNTTYYNYNFGDTYVYNGIGVKIEILRKFSASKKIKKLRKRERAFAFNSYKYKRKLSVKNTFLKWGMGFRLAFARKSIAARLYRDCIKAYAVEEDFVMNYGIINKKRTGLIKYPSYLLTARELVTFEGHSLYVPHDIEKHIKIILGRKPLEKLPEQVNNVSVITSDVIPYDTYITDMKKRKKLSAMRQNLWKTDQMHGAVTYFVRKDWKIMLCVNARLDLMEEYMPLKSRIIGLYSRHDMDGLGEILANYDEQARNHFAQTKMTIYFDKDIFNIYMAWLGANHGTQIVKKMRKRVPKEWKN